VNSQGETRRRVLELILIAGELLIPLPNNRGHAQTSIHRLLNTEVPGVLALGVNQKFSSAELARRRDFRGTASLLPPRS